MLINCDEHVVVSETPVEDRDDYNSLLKELIKLIKGGESCSPGVSSVSAIKDRYLPAQVNYHSKSVTCCLVELFK